MYKLYYYPGNANLAPHMLLNEIGAPHQLVLVDCSANAQKGEAFLKVNPLGRVPALQDGELIVTEAAAICLHLVDRHPDSHMAPSVGTAARARFYQWMMYLTNTLQAEMMTYFYPERLAAEPALAGRVKASAEARTGVMLEYIDQALAANGGTCLTGNRVSAVDFYLLMLSRWTRFLDRPARTYPALGPYLQALLERPSVQRTFAAEGIVSPLV